MTRRDVHAGRTLTVMERFTSQRHFMRRNTLRGYYSLGTQKHLACVAPVHLQWWCIGPKFPNITVLVFHGNSVSMVPQSSTGGCFPTTSTLLFWCDCRSNPATSRNLTRPQSHRGATLLGRQKEAVLCEETLLAGYMTERTEMRNSELWSMKMEARRALFQPPTAPSLGGKRSWRDRCYTTLWVLDTGPKRVF